MAARAVCATARQLGYQAHLLTTSLQGEAREVGKAFALLASYLCHEEPPEGRHFSISEVTPVLQVSAPPIFSAATMPGTHLCPVRLPSPSTCVESGPNVT